MARVEFAAAAVEDLATLIAVLSLPADTTDRVRRSIEALAQFPNLGPEVAGRWTPMRFILGPWRWMLILYTYEHDNDRVIILTIQDARAAVAPTSSRDIL